MDAGIGVVGSVATAPGRITAAAAQQAIDNAPTAFQAGARQIAFGGIANDARWASLSATDKFYYEVGQATIKPTVWESVAWSEYRTMLPEARGAAYLQNLTLGEMWNAWNISGAFSRNVSSGITPLERAILFGSANAAPYATGLNFGSQALGGATDWFGRPISNGGK
jgi:hypothetical protein